MRVNVYAEEITERVEIVEKTADTGSTFVGVRFYLKTHEDMLMPKHPDNDDSAVTFWCKSSKSGFKGGDEETLMNLFREASERLYKLRQELYQ